MDKKFFPPFRRVFESIFFFARIDIFKVWIYFHCGAILCRRKSLLSLRKPSTLVEPFFLLFIWIDLPPKRILISRMCDKADPFLSIKNVRKINRFQDLQKFFLKDKNIHACVLYPFWVCMFAFFLYTYKILNEWTIEFVALNG